MPDTIFGKIARGEIPADLVYEDDEVVAFRDLSPQAPTHILVIPRKPIPTLNDAEAEDHVEDRPDEAEIPDAVKNGRLQPDDNVVFVAAAGQTVFHLHVHLLGGRPMGWPPG